MVTARELSLAEIKEIRRRFRRTWRLRASSTAPCAFPIPAAPAKQLFCGQGCQPGACTHPCRWKYSVVEETRPGEYMPVYENERGTYIFNSKDLCMIEHIPEMIDAGIDSFQDRRQDEDGPSMWRL